jgi:hypothetical protein
MSQYEQEPSGMAVGGVVFAAVMMMMIGVFQTIAAISALAKDDLFVVTDKYVFDLSVTGWGWIHLILGIVIIFAGLAVLAGKVWGAMVAIVLATLSAVANFFWIPYYPFWAILIIADDIWVIWALTRPGIYRTP